MAVLCSFKAIVGSPCSHDRRDQSKPVNEVQLLSSVKDIESKLQHLPHPGKPRAFDSFLCPGSAEFDPCLGGVGKIEPDV